MAKEPTRKAEVRPDTQTGMDPTPSTDEAKAATKERFAEADAKAAPTEDEAVGRQVRGW